MNHASSVVTKQANEGTARIYWQENGVYSISGSNLSVTGEWRIRTTVQRPDEFDALADFKPALALQPLPVQVPPPDPNAPLPYRTLALLAAGLSPATNSTAAVTITLQPRWAS